MAIETVRPQHSWEQQLGETDHEYRCFAVFRSLGIRRTIATVARAYHKELKRAAEQDPTITVTPAKYLSDNMSTSAKRWNWTARAKAYDAHTMIKHGEAAATGFVKLIDETVRVCLKAIKEKAADIQPSNFKELIEGLETIASLIPPETLRAICDNARLAGLAESKPAISA